MIDRESGIPIYIQIQEIFEEMLQNGELSPGDMVPSENEFSEKLGVSRLTVRKGYSELVKRNIFFTMHGKGTFVKEDYKVITKEGTARRKQRIIGVILPEIAYFFNEILDGIKTYAYGKGFTISIMLNDTEENEITAIEAMISNNVIGVIIAPSRKALAVIEHYQQLLNSHIPVVMIGKPPFKILSDSVYSDDTFASYRCIELLLDHENKNISFITGSLYNDESESERRIGYINAMCDYELKENINILYIDSHSFNDDLMKDISKENPVTAFFCYSDEIAIKLYNILTNSGIKVPDQIEIMGFDNNPTNDLVEVSTVYQRRKEIGENAVILLIDKINRPNEYLINHHVIIHPKIIEKHTSRH